MLIVVSARLRPDAARPGGGRRGEQGHDCSWVSDDRCWCWRPAAAGLLARSVPDIPGLLVAYGRYAATWVGLSNIIYVGEGLNAFVAVSQLSNGVRNYHNAGKVQASSEPQDMRLQRMLGHLTHLIPKTPKQGARHRLRRRRRPPAPSASVLTSKTMTIAEIEPLVPASVVEVLRRAQLRRRPTKPKKVTIHIDDARHFLLTTNEKFDAITSDPLDPWVKGAATLYTQEFFELVKQPPESRRRGHAVRPALREQHGRGEERDRHLLQGVPERRRLGQHEQRRRATTWC